MREPGYYWVLYYTDWLIGRYSDGRWYLTYDVLDGDADFTEINETRILAPDETFKNQISDNQILGDNSFSRRLTQPKLREPERNPLLKAQAILDSMPSHKDFLVNFSATKPVFPDGYIPGFSEYVKAAYLTDTVPMDIRVKHYINFVNGLTH